MSDKRISDLVELTTLAADDVLPVVDADANATKRVTYDTLATDVRSESEPLTATTITASTVNAGNFVGAVQFFAMDSPPDGWLKANGAEVSRATYSDLFAAIGTTFGSGDGSTTFDLPDLRGEFLRGWDDGRGVDSGRSFGSAQSDANKQHKHNFNLADWKEDSGESDNFNVGESDAPTGGPRIGFTVNKVFSTNESRKALWDGNTNNPAIRIANDGGPESRPRNVALLACIKF